MNHPKIKIFSKFNKPYIFIFFLIFPHPYQVIHPFNFNIFKMTLFVKKYLYKVLLNKINMLLIFNKIT